jgi:trans-aconitate methyltransferase
MARPKGAKSTNAELRQLQWEKFSLWLMTEGMRRFQTEMQRLKGREYVATVKDLMEYFQPKLARIDNVHTVNREQFEKLESIIRSITRNGDAGEDAIP